MMYRITSKSHSSWKALAGKYGFDFYQTIYETNCWSQLVPHIIKD
jgi:hypothetical protein